MDDALIVLGVCAWLTCGAFGYAVELHYFTRKYPWFKNGGLAELFVRLMFGPAALFASLTSCSPLGILWKPLTREQRWYWYHQKWPSLSFASFLASEKRDGYVVKSKEQLKAGRDGE